MAYFEISNFFGGLNTLINDDNINPDEAVRLNNVCISSSVIKPMKEPKPTGNKMKKNSYWFDNELITSDEDRFYVQFGNLLYWSNSEGYITRYDHNNETVIGSHNPPQNEPIVEIINEPSLIDGNYSYVLTYIYDELFESPPSPIANIDVQKKKVKIKVNNDVPDNVTNIKIYRAGGLNPNFCLVASIEPNETEYIDAKGDFEIVGNELYIMDNYPPIYGLDMLVNNSGTFFAAKGKRVYWSFNGTPEYWSPYSYIEFENDITGLINYGGYIIAFTKDKMYRISGLNDTNISAVELPFNYGCSNKRTIQKYNNLLLWFSQKDNKDIICSFNGSSVRELTLEDKFLGKASLGDRVYKDFSEQRFTDEKTEPITSVVVDNKYLLFFKHKIMIIDFNIGGKIYYMSQSFVGSYIKNNMVFVCDESGDEYELYPSFSKYLNFEYATGRLDFGDNTTKEYRRVNIRGSGNFKCIVYIDKRKVYETDYKENRFFLPAESFGKTIQFNLKSKGYAKIEAIGVEYTKVGV